MPSMSWACWGILIRSYVSPAKPPTISHLVTSIIHSQVMTDQTSMMDSLYWRQRQTDREREKGKLWREKPLEKLLILRQNNDESKQLTD